MTPEVKNAIALLLHDPQTGNQEAAAAIAAYITELERKAEQVCFEASFNVSEAKERTGAVPVSWSAIVKLMNVIDFENR